MNKTRWLKEYKIGNEDVYSKLFTFNMDDLVSLQGASSKGDQRKWIHTNGNLYVKEQLYDDKQYWKDNLVEVIASDTLRQLGTVYDYADYYVCSIQDANIITQGCVSRNFLPENTELITLSRMLKNNGIEYRTFTNPKDSWKYLCDIVYKVSKVDCKHYLATLLTVDYLLLNIDRHLNNIAFICKEYSVCQASPMFDFGRGLLEGESNLYDTPNSKVLDKIRLKPFGHKANAMIDVILNDIDVTSEWNTKIDITDYTFPRYKAKLLFTETCKNVGITVKEN